MIKLFLCMVVVLSATLAGNSFSLKLTHRCQSLFTLIEALTKIKTHISFGACEIRQVVSESFLSAKDFELLESDDVCEDFNFWWNDSVKRLAPLAALNREDTKLMLRFGEMLGVTDIQGQLDNCDLYISLFSQRYKCAKDAECRCKRLYRVLGFSCGCVMALILL